MPGIFSKRLGTKPASALECMKKLGLSHRPTFRQNYLQPALAAGLIERTLPDKPNSRLQKYRRRGVWSLHRPGCSFALGGGVSLREVDLPCACAILKIDPSDGRLHDTPSNP